MPFWKVIAKPSGASRPARISAALAVLLASTKTIATSASRANPAPSGAALAGTLMR